jgi:hypothetical protein
MWDRKGKLVYDSKRKSTASWVKSIETVLEEGERIVGIKAYNQKNVPFQFAYHFSFQFVIGRME